MYSALQEMRRTTAEAKANAKGGDSDAVDVGGYERGCDQINHKNSNSKTTAVVTQQQQQPNDVGVVAVTVVNVSVLLSIRKRLLQEREVG